MKPTYTQRDIADAATAWEIGGSIGLGLFYTRNKATCGNDYGALVRAVRRYLSDTTDYSRADNETDCRTNDAS